MRGLTSVHVCVCMCVHVCAGVHVGVVTAEQRVGSEIRQCNKVWLDADQHQNPTGTQATHFGR